MVAALLFKPFPSNILLVGLGGGSLAKFLLRYLPNCRITVIEPRKDVINIAYGYFQLPETVNLEVINMSAQQFLPDHCPHNHFDLIFIDAFDHAGIPPPLKTSKFVNSCATALVEDGVITLNLWENSVLEYRYLIGELEKAYDGNLLTLPVRDKGNTIIFASKKGDTLKPNRAHELLAQSLYVDTGLDFPAQLKALKRSNRWQQFKRLFR